MRRQKVLFSAVLLLFLVRAVSALGADEAVRLGYLRNDLHQLACFVALEKGYFEKAGVRVKVAGIFKAGPEEMSAFAARALDAGYVGEAPATVAVANGTADVKIIAQVNLEGSAIVTRKDSRLTALKDLVGRTVAVPGYATVQDFLLSRALEKAKIPARSVNKIVLKPPEMIPALQTKQIDAFIAWEPYPSKAVVSRVGEILLRSGDLWPKHPCCVLVVANHYLTSRPKIVRELVKSHVKATEYIRDHFEEAAAIGVKYTGMDEATVKLAMKNIRYEWELDIPGEVEYVTFLNRSKVIKVEEPGPFVEGIITSRFLRKSLPGQ